MPHATTTPPCLHLLSIGDAALPPGLDGWLARHPGWVVQRWTDDDLDGRPWRLAERMAAAIAEHGPAARDEVATLMRWEILAEQGGVAVLPGRPAPEALPPRLEAGNGWAEDAAEGWIACPPGHPNVLAALESAQTRPRSARGLLNIVMMTIRTGGLMQRITETLAADSRRHPGVRLTVADGAENEEKTRWLHALAAQGGDLRIVSHVDPHVRFKAALTDEHDWTLLVADDDPFSLDYVDAFVTHLATVPPQVGTVAPGAYVRRLGDQVRCNTIAPLHAPEPAQRLGQWLGQTESVFLTYYAAVRTPIFLEWARYLNARPHPFSHADQLLTALAALRGAIEPVRAASALTREEDNWATNEAWVRSDMRFYPRHDMVLLHELWWVADLVRLLGVPGRPALAGALKPRALQLLQANDELWPLRERLAGPRAGVDWAGLRKACATLRRHLAEAEEPAVIEQAFRQIEAFARAAEFPLLAD